MNVHDSEKLAGMLESLGYEVTEENSEADVIVFNTCAIRKGAEDRAIGNIGNLKKLKKENPDLIIAVCGCMTQQKVRADELRTKFPFVNIIFGTHNLYKFRDYLIEYQKTKKRVVELFEKSDGNEEKSNMYRTSGQNAYINIMYGCNNFCTYCIVPYVRGREQSRNHRDVIKECISCIDNGYKFITLLGQNVNSYNDGEYNFAQLLKAICSLEGDFRLKFMTSHPKDLTDDVIDCIANEDKLCKTIHLPVQSGNSNVLHRMNRRYTREHYLNLVKRIRKKIDGDISTDIIVGFPGETQEEFEDTLTLVKEVGFVQLFGYMYSRREGTPADKFPDQVNDEIKNERVNILLNLQKEMLQDIETKMKGRKMVAFSTEIADGKTIMVLDNFKNVEVDGIYELNKFYKVLINDFKDNKLIGIIV